MSHLHRLTILFATLSTPALSQVSKPSIAKCAVVASPTERLSCYDALAKSNGLDRPQSVPTPTAGGTGKWRVSTEVSPIDDTKNVFVSIDANESIRGMLGRANPTLILRCKEKETQAYIAWEVYLGLDETTVLTRLDEAPAEKAEWSISTDNKASFHQEPIPFAKSLLGHRRLLAQVTPYGESPALVTFSIAGADQAIAPLRQACGW